MNYLEYMGPALFLTNKRNKIANYVPLILLYYVESFDQG